MTMGLTEVSPEVLPPAVAGLTWMLGSHRDARRRRGPPDGYPWDGAGLQAYRDRGLGQRDVTLTATETSEVGLDGRTVHASCREEREIVRARRS
jgi:hypothetical protein